MKSSKKFFGINFFDKTFASLKSLFDNFLILKRILGVFEYEKMARETSMSISRKGKEL